MKFLLHQGLGPSTIHQIGNYLRRHGSAHHWIERYRGDIFVFVSDQADEAILRNKFSGLLDVVNDTETDMTPMSAKAFNETVKLKRAYERPTADDGKRVLIDRLRPRGVKKTEAAIDHWMKELAPSTELRRWFGHDPRRWEEFRRRYAAEIREHHDELDRLRNMMRVSPVTLVYSAHDEAHNDAVVLREILLRHR
ncbi:DUF488 domain-containing protein [Mesorhizobium sp. VK4C]|nr:DUF488 domain-containing protein [Mesorhizobium sp. VK4C]MDX8502950.1 DUF488 domain-containing protein [Mesorhizobium sp. VK4C]